MNFKRYKYFIVASFVFLFVGISYSQQGWVNQNSGITESLNSVKFINADTGWCAGNTGKILKTTNGGINWIQQEISYRIILLQ